MKLLIVEDQPKTGHYLRQGLTEAGFNVELVADGNTGQHLALTGDYALLILDVMLPGRDGWQILQAVRSAGLDIPVLFLTARDAVEDRVHGLELGADDYLVKPFELVELEARVKALLRRAQGGEAPVYSCGALQFDTVSRMFSYGNAVLALTPREHAVLEVLISRAGRVVSKEKLFDEVFSLIDDANPDAIEIYIHRLRKKLQRLDAEAVAITTLRGLGYLLEVAAEK